MGREIVIPSGFKTKLVLLAAFYLLLRLPLLFYLPLVKDEAIYSLMVHEQVQGASIIPTFMGYEISWKPAFFFWVYAASTVLPLPTEAAFRLPSLLFGLASLPLLLCIYRNLKVPDNVAFFSMVIFIASVPSIYPNAALLTDSLNFLFMCLGVFFYTSDRMGRERFLYAAAATMLAFFVKMVIAVLIPAIAVAYLYFNDRRMLRDPAFLLSLLAVPLAFAAHYTLLDAHGLAKEVYLSDIGGKIVSRNGPASQLQTLLGSVTTLFLGAGAWFALSLAGFKDWFRENPVLSLWFLFIAFPLISGNFMVWYYLPVMPAVAYFATALLLRADGLGRMDFFFLSFFTMTLIVTLMLAGFVYYLWHENFYPEKEAGLILAGKDNVLIIGDYRPGVLSYKMNGEYAALHKTLDVGWIFGTEYMPPEQVEEYMRDYNSDRYGIHEGSFTSMFTSDESYRKDSGLSQFDYIAVCGNYTLSINNSRIIYMKYPGITIYEVKD